jgi:hypothetical protein
MVYMSSNCSIGAVELKIADLKEKKADKEDNESDLDIDESAIMDNLSLADVEAHMSQAKSNQDKPDEEMNGQEDQGGA